MTKQLSSIDMHFLLKELKNLEKSRVDKIYNHGKGEIYIIFFKSGEGKKILRIISGKAIFLAETRDSDEKPSHTFIIDGLILAYSDNVFDEREIDWLRQTAEVNDLNLHWFEDKVKEVQRSSITGVKTEFALYSII